MVAIVGEGVVAIVGEGVVAIVGEGVVRPAGRWSCRALVMQGVGTGLRLVCHATAMHCRACAA